MGNEVHHFLHVCSKLSKQEIAQEMTGRANYLPPSKKFLECIKEMIHSTMVQQSEEVKSVIVEMPERNNEMHHTVDPDHWCLELWKYDRGSSLVPPTVIHSAF